MSLENELNEILENTDKVYAAGQSSIADTKMDKFGEVITHELTGRKTIVLGQGDIIEFVDDEYGSNTISGFSTEIITDFDGITTSEDHFTISTHNNACLWLTDNGAIICKGEPGTKMPLRGATTETLDGYPDEYCYVNIGYLNSKLEALEARIQELEGGAE